MRTPVYLALLILAVWLNRKDGRMAALTLVLAVSIFIPAPTEWPNYYIFCGAAEIIVGLIALVLDARASIAIAEICIVLVFTHFMGYYRDGSLPFSQYRVLQAMLESAEILCCILMSAPVALLFRNRGRP